MPNVAMNAVLIPVRSMTGAKNRLSAQLDENARTQLTLAMLADMVLAAQDARLVDAVYVVSADTELLERAGRLGADTLEEASRASGDAINVVGSVQVRGGLNRAVYCAARELARRGVRRLLTIPGDVPLVGADEIDELFSAITPVVLAPSVSGTGTNGLLTSPPDVIVPRFEGQSLTAHMRACDAAGVDHATFSLPGFALDIDTMDDLRVLAASGAERESVNIAAELLATELDVEATSARAVGAFRR